MAEDFSVLRQSDYLTALQQPFSRWNRLYLNTTTVTLRPVNDWSLGLGYGYYQNNLRSDLMYGTDPFYAESLVPFKAINQSSFCWWKQLRSRSARTRTGDAGFCIWPCDENEGSPRSPWPGNLRFDCTGCGARDGTTSS